MKRQYGVIGLGRFGSSVARHLAALGQDVIAVDLDEECVQAVDLPEIYAVQADATNKKALQEVGIQNVETVIIAIGENIEASILATMICKKLGVVSIIAKADNVTHAQVLRHIGVSRVIFPEEEMAARLARSIVSGLLLDYIELAPHVSIMETQVPPGITGRTLSDLQMPRKYGITILAIKRGDKMIVPPRGDDVLQTDDIVVLLGDREAIERLR